MSQLQILILEDDPIDLELIETALKQGGIDSNFIKVSHRQEFLEQLEAKTPDVILSDYRLPTFDGASALELAQSICPQVPFILVSGVLGEEKAIEALKQGATDYVLKQRLGRLAPSVKRALRETRDRRERETVAKALRETDDLLRAIVNASPVGIITLTHEQRIMTWNAAAETLYGYSASAVTDQPLPLIPPDQREVFDRCFSQAIHNQTVSNQEFQHLRQDGKLVDVSLSLAPLHHDDDSVYGVVMTVSDITVRKQIETQRLNLLKQESSARAAAETTNRIKDEFLAVLSHELRTPLNAIVGWIGLIQRGNLKPDVLQRALDTIERNAAAQTQLIEDLLDLSRIIRGQMTLSIQPVNSVELMQATVETLRPAAEAKSMSVHLDLDENTPLVLADPNRLQQIYWNLLSNAIKFTPDSGKISVRVRSIQNQLRIQVTDSGIGIHPDFIPHVFDHFRQADGSTVRAKGGLGLGLAITRRLVELHGGTIEVDSAGVGQGATFNVMFPMRTVTDSPQTKTEAIDGSLSLQGTKVIVVDDETDARNLLAVILEQQGAQVKSAGSAYEAFQVLRQFHPDVIISDIAMPNEDGYSFLEKVRALPNSPLSQVPAISLMAYAQAEDHRQSRAAGYDYHISKPFNPTDVVAAVSHLLAQGSALG